MAVAQVGIAEGNRAGLRMRGRGVLDDRAGLGAAGDADGVIGASYGDCVFLGSGRAVLVVPLSLLGALPFLAGSQVLGFAVVQGVGPADRAIGGVGCFG